MEITTFQGIAITNPFYDETGRFLVDPYKYYKLSKEQVYDWIAKGGYQEWKKENIVPVKKTERLSIRLEGVLKGLK